MVTGKVFIICCLIVTAITISYVVVKDIIDEKKENIMSPLFFKIILVIDLVFLWGSIILFCIILF